MGTNRNRRLTEGLSTITDLGAVLLCLGGVATVGILTQDAHFGFILPILHVMTMGIAVTVTGLVAMIAPRYAPVSGIVGMGIAYAVLGHQYHAPLWAAPAVLGGLLCVVGGLGTSIAMRRPSRGERT